MDIDLTIFDLETAGVYPYFKITLDDNVCRIYEGAIGKNRFNYFEISKKSKAWKSSLEFYNKYIINHEHRFSYSEDYKKLLDQIKNGKDLIIRNDNLEAYYKYWNSFSNEEKLVTHFNIIPHFEALKEWHSLSLNHFILTHQKKFLDLEVREIEINKFNKLLVTEVLGYLKPNNQSRSSIISSAHAKELFKFYNWLISQNKGAIQRTLQCKLSEQEVMQIFKLAKELNVFEEPFYLNDLTNLFNCQLLLPLNLKNNKNFVTIFNELRIKNLISSDWQSILGKSQSLKGSRGATITAKNFISIKYQCR